MVDHGSRVGTFLNGVKLEASKPSALAAGDLLRIGPWTFRAKLVGREASQGVAATIDDSAAPAQRVERAQGVHSKAAQRLHLLGECMARLSGSVDEHGLARIALESALEGSGFARGAVLKRIGAGEEVQIVESARRSEKDGSEFVFSRSLVRRAAAGEVSVLTVDRSGQAQHSIAELRIHSAMCAPVFLAGSVEGFLYLDARGHEESVHAEAAGFCEAVARAYGLAMSNLKRIELQARQRTMERDLEAAREAQQMMLPPAEGQRGPIRYAMQMRPGLFVAGDMFDIVPLPEGRAAICVGDVAGHGVGSAMLMALAQSYLHAQLQAKMDAGSAVTAVNTFVAERSTAGRFASLWVGVFSRSGDGLRVDFVDAGHGHWLLRPGMARRPGPFPPSGPSPSASTRIGTSHPSPCSWGAATGSCSIATALSSSGTRRGSSSGKEGLIAALTGAKSAADDMRAAFGAIDVFSGGGGLEDDATVASIEFAE